MRFPVFCFLVKNKSAGLADRAFLGFLCSKILGSVPCSHVKSIAVLLKNSITIDKLVLLLP